MSGAITTPRFKENAHDALGDARLQRALGHARNFIPRRAAAVARLPEFDALRDSARDIKDHTLAHLDLYLEAYERKVTEAGGFVHYARDSAEACKIFLDLAKARGAKSVTKGKSMISEEIGLNQAIEAEGMEAIETDLGEYIIQLRGEAPSHIIAPAIHVTRDDVEADFRKVHLHLPADRDLSQPEQLLAEARGILRNKFLNADIGVTGANFLIAETGTSIIVTNEGNGDLTQILPKVHVVIARRRRAVAAGAGALGDRPGYVGLYDALHRPATRRRSRRAGGISRYPARQRALGDARHRFRGHAALHTLRRLHEPLPGIPPDRRPCLRLGLSRPDGRGADALTDRRGRGRPIA